jgi:magnesium transporter
MVMATPSDRDRTQIRADRRRGETAERLGISSHKVGMAPGSVVFSGQRHLDRPIISTMTYTPAGANERDDVRPDDLHVPASDEPGVHWINVVGLHDPELILAIGERFDLHPLLLEDVTSVRSRPAFVDYENHAFLSLKMLSWSDPGGVDVEHVSLILGDNYVIAFQERPGDVFDSVRNRIRGGKTRIRRRDAEYLWYAMIDAVVDHYLIVIEELASRVDRLEDTVWNGEETDDVPSEVQSVRVEMNVVRRALRPLRDEIDQIAKEPPEWFSDDIEPFIADLRVHVFHISDALDTMRESMASVMDAHLSLVTMRTNDVMKVLTIMASIFIPLTFVAGVYGMNFQHMPELDEPWAYPAVWVVMVAIGLAMVAYFRRKGWL